MNHNAVSHNKVGGVYQEQGRLADALQEYKADLAIAEHLAALEPGNEQWEKDLDVTRKDVERLREMMGSTH